MSKKTLSSAMLVLLVATGALSAVAQATTSAPTTQLPQADDDNKGSGSGK